MLNIHSQEFVKIFMPNTHPQEYYMVSENSGAGLSSSI